MATEQANYISELQSGRPGREESVGEGDLHIKMLKQVLQNQFSGPSDGSDPWDVPLTRGPRYLNTLTSDIDDLPGSYMTLQTAQTASGQKRFTQPIQADQGIITEPIEGQPKNLVTGTSSETLVGHNDAALSLFGSDPNDIRYTWPGNQSGVVLHTGNFIELAIDALYPVGSLYFSTNTTNPSIQFPGTTWVRYAEGQFLVGAGTHTDPGGDTKTTNAGQPTPGGRFEHTLSESQIPLHTHAVTGQAQNGPAGDYWLRDQDGNFAHRFTSSSAYDYGDTRGTGGGGKHNNTPPGIGIVVWRRTA